MSGGRWQFWIDVGGTFTDCIARRPDGTVAVHKLLSTGVYRSELLEGSGRGTLLLGDRHGDPDGFFEGWSVALLRPASEGTGAEVLDADVPVAGFDPARGRARLARRLTTDPLPGMLVEFSCPEESPVIGMRWLLGRRLHEEIGPVDVRLGTTRGTNALLERQGVPTALVVTRGFRDVLRIAYQSRPALFDLDIRTPSALYETVVELDERVDAAGRVLRPLDEAAVREGLAGLRERGIASLAVCLMNSYRNAAHEELVAAVATEMGFAQVSVSARLSPLQKVVSRGDTTVVDAYLTPIIRDYVDGIAATVPGSPLKLMTSAGALVDAQAFVGKDSILSGPAGGVVGCAQAAQQAGFARAIGFDMGGTSTDVSRFDGSYERRYEMEVNDPESGTGVRIVAPMMAIETVAAGGGSICAFDGEKPVVGPRSAGAHPGPACYGRGGPLTVTDVNFYLGKILPDHFPFPLDRRAVERRLDELRDAIAEATGRRYGREQLAEGFTAIANANMSAPIKKVSIARGYDVRDYCLVSFGSAAAQHACAIARELGIRRVLLNPFGGVLSAYGIGMADITKFAERHVGRAYEDAIPEGDRGDPDRDGELEPLFAEMLRHLREQVRAEGIRRERVRPARRLLDLRYVGQDTCITVPRPDDGDYRSEFERRHRQLYGFAFPGRSVEIQAARTELVGETDKPRAVVRPVRPGRPRARQHARSWFGGRHHRTPVFARGEVVPGDVIEGPAIIAEPVCTIVVEPGWTAEVTANDDILLSLSGTPRDRADLGTEADPIMLELFNNQFTSIAEQMGSVLQKTALSTNVKERLDFSCAIFTAAGDLVVNAPHIPVHLGAMSECVKRLMEDVPAMRPGEVYITNDPFRGGSHLPDVTVVTPVFADGPGGPDATPVFFTASRAHHAEIGGVTPGSMPPFSTRLAEEGVLIRHFRLVKDDLSSEADLRRILAGAPFPSRSVDENIADVNAQVAANQAGVSQLRGVVRRYGLDVVHAYMGHIQRAAENATRAALLRIPEGRHRFCDRLEDGSAIRVAITVRHAERDGLGGGEATIDFSGTDPVVHGNLNANSAIVASAVIYCFRCLVDEDIPLNAGVLAPLEIVLPPDCLLNPRPTADPADLPAVVGGNVETSQRIVDVILGALGVAAASQGTMNNFIFGRSASGDAPAFGYYETICGGAGAGPTFDGADAVHTHMTNTRLTDPEVLEDRYPVRLRRFEIRRGSGGAGRHRGGDGIVREVEFLAPLEVSLLTSRRNSAPYGLAGGRPGTPGRNLLNPDGPEARELPGAALFTAAPGDVLRIETPGGGGMGSPPDGDGRPR